MSDVKIKVIDSDKLINAINEGSYDVNLSAVMAFGAVMSDTKRQEICEYCHEDSDGMDELISKQAAIDVIRKDKIDSNSLKIMGALGNGNEALTVNMTCDRHIQLLKNLHPYSPNER